MTRSVIYVGSGVPGDVVDTTSFHSSQSLLDSDIVVFEPPQDFESYQSYQGKPSLGEADSFRFKEACSHWRSEMGECLGAGKTVIVFLAPYQEFFVDSGDRKYSGTGRNEKTTILVSPFDNYKCLPMSLEGLTPRSGKAVRPVGDIGPLRDFWATYGKDLEYNLYFSDARIQPLLVTKTGEKTIAGLFRTAGGGCLVLVPPIDWDWDEFTNAVVDDEEVWTNEAVRFGHTLLDIILGIDSGVRGSQEKTPPPEWSSSDEYALEAERALRTEIADLTGQIEVLKDEVLAKRSEAQDATQLRALLFSTGKELEAAVVLALRILGFDAEGFGDGDSEFDVVFKSSEGRFLGEVEGKDNKAINVDKLRQLEMNIQEDFQRDDVDEYAVGVLFGNAFRLTDPAQRTRAFFTDKCMKGVARSGAVLVRTPDLFVPARFVLENDNTKRYARSVRSAISKSAGKVAVLPAPPVQAAASVAVSGGDA